MDEIPALIDLAGAVADGRAVDWSAAAASANTPTERASITALGLIARVAEAFEATEQPAPSQVSRDPGDRWGRLEIVGRIGGGTFGSVYRARDARLDRDVALKLLREGTDESDQARDAEVIAEGRLLARITHPNVVRVFGADRYEGQVGIWMELVEGVTLEEELTERGPFRSEEAISIAIDVCHAVAAVHAAGLLHRDIKLQNVMRDRRDGRIVLMDLSAGRELADPTRPGALAQTLAGSPSSWHPRSWKASGATPHSDVYSLGVVLFRLLHRPVSRGRWVARRGR